MAETFTSRILIRSRGTTFIAPSIGFGADGIIMGGQTGAVIFDQVTERRALLSDGGDLAQKVGGSGRNRTPRGQVKSLVGSLTFQLPNDYDSHP